MIRDEYKKSQEKRKQSLKEIEGIKKMGERAYYTNTIKKVTANQKTLNFNTWFTFLFSLGLVVFTVVLLIFDLKYLKEPYMIIALVVIGVFGGWALAWFTFVKKLMTKKIETYKALVEEIKTKEMEKQKSIYKMYNKGE
ncbi:MAG: hypothetical protein IKA85_01090 [Clostridia bacterium]|nr:hypothetical protein [Clostridia bacterium]